MRAISSQDMVWCVLIFVGTLSGHSDKERIGIDGKDNDKLHQEDCSGKAGEGKGVPGLQNAWLRRPSAAERFHLILRNCLQG